MSVNATGATAQSDSPTPAALATPAPEGAGEVERLNAILDSLDELVSRSLPDGTVTYVNLAFERRIGQPRAAVLGRSWLAMVDAREAAAYSRWIASVGPAQPRRCTTNSVPRPDGTSVMFAWLNLAIFDADGQLVEVQSTGREVGRTSAKTPHLPALTSLTPRELALVKLLVASHRLADAATALGISVHTARNHLRAIFDKLRVRSQAELIAACRAALSDDDGVAKAEPTTHGLQGRQQ